VATTDGSGRAAQVAVVLQAINQFIGRSVAWLTVAMVIVTAIVVVERYWLESGSIQLQESITYMHAAVFMLAAAYTFAAGGHVRVDIFYRDMAPARKALVDILGTLLLLMPFCLFLAWSSWDYVAMSWTIEESSGETGGLPHPFPALMKSLIPVSAALLFLQGLVLIIESMLTIVSIRTERGAD